MQLSDFSVNKWLGGESEASAAIGVDPLGDVFAIVHPARHGSMLAKVATGVQMPLRTDQDGTVETRSAKPALSARATASRSASVALRCTVFMGRFPIGRACGHGRGSR